MALSNYGELKTGIANFLNRDDLTSIIPTFIALTEAQIARDLRHWRQEVRVSTTVDERFENLPTDWLEGVHLSLADGSTVEYGSVAEISRQKLLSNNTAGQPRLYTLNSGQIEFFPAPDESYTLTMIYYARIPTMSGDTDANWLMTSYPDVYLYGSLLQSAPYLGEDERMVVWAQLYSAAVKNLGDDSKRARSSGGPLIMRNA
tara:strand:+ start:2642 stop:3250 length:609 start_codon:yes stop_codon:yes gene_type:complete